MVKVIKVKNLVKILKEAGFFEIGSCKEGHLFKGWNGTKYVKISIPSHYKHCDIPVYDIKRIEKQTGVKIVSKN